MGSGDFFKLSSSYLHDHQFTHWAFSPALLKIFICGCFTLAVLNWAQAYSVLGIDLTTELHSLPGVLKEFQAQLRCSVLSGFLFFFSLSVTLGIVIALSMSRVHLNCGIIISEDWALRFMHHYSWQSEGSGSFGSVIGLCSVSGRWGWAFMELTAEGQLGLCFLKTPTLLTCWNQGLTHPLHNCSICQQSCVL